MKKLLYLIPLFGLLLLTSCINTNSIEKDIHDYRPSYNEEYHYNLCECGEKENIEAHTFTEEVIVEPTCETEGKIKYTCSCGYTKEETVEALGHTPKKVDGTLATCDNTGLSDGVVCSTCGKTLEVQTITPKLNHEFGQWEIDTEATCISKGKEKRECIHCHIEEYRDIEKIAHTPTPYTNLAADCTHEGHTGGSYCSFCNQELEPKTVIDKTSHSYGEWITTDEPTCIAIGHAKRVCEVCGNTEYKDLEKTAHTPVAYDELEANCQHEGHTGGTYCSYCHQELSPYTTIDKTGHDYGNWIETQPATCISKGQEKRVCNVCGHEDFRDIEMTTHIPTPGEAEESTCTKHGHTAGSYCSFCHKELQAPEELPLASHQYTEETITKYPSYTEEGSKTVKCAHCTSSYLESIPKLEFTQTVWQNSLTLDSIKNKTIEGAFYDFTTNKNIDYTISNKGSLYFVFLYDVSTGEQYEYYTNLNEVAETLNDGYKHATYKESDNQYLYYVNILLTTITNTSNLASTATWDSTDSLFKVTGEVENYKGTVENTQVSIKIDSNGKLLEFGTGSSTLVITISEITDSMTLQMPTTTYHTFHKSGNDYICDVCNKTYTLYSGTKDNIKVYYYQNKTNPNDIQFEYQSDLNLTFYEPLYYTNGTIKRFTSVYYDGTTSSKQIKSVSIIQNKVLKITYKDSTVQRLLLLKDGTCKEVSSDYATDSNQITSSPVGEVFYLPLSTETIRYHILSTTSVERLDCKEINLYNIQNKNYIDYDTRNLESLFGKTLLSYSDGKKHDGTTGQIYFRLDSNLNLQIDYDYNDNPAFSVVTFKNIEGYYNPSTGSDLIIYFMADNNNYKLRYNGNIEITKI